MNSFIPPLIPWESSLASSSPLSASSSSSCAKHMVGFLERGWLSLIFPQGKEASSPGFGWTVGSLDPRTSRQFYWIFFLSLPGGPKVIWTCSHLWSHLQVGYHCLQLLGKSTIEAIPLSSTMCSGGKWSGKDTANICKHLERWMPQSDTVSLSAHLQLK